MDVATQAWWFAAVRLLGAIALGLVVGFLLDNVWAGLAGMLALFLAWQLANLFRLEWWVRHRSFADPPDLGGIWGAVVATVTRVHRRKRGVSADLAERQVPVLINFRLANSQNSNLSH